MLTGSSIPPNTNIYLHACYLQEFHQALKLKIQQISPWILGSSGREKKLPFEMYPEHSLQVLSSKETHIQKPYLPVGQLATSTPFHSLDSPKRRGKKVYETLLKVATQEFRPTKRLRLNHSVIECFPSFSPYHRINKAPV